ncbi:hypothetical protein [Candidatus Venteria ishoeyi]|uniref:Uncharacterized protein n=1 Tax=Candidatus Venteria ishoeyi TaxID=1899563 RepID=A0A1H6FGP4_9GAMM|nr:hypothetical protein [Candidatus Venteria ishoeyi]MDM8545484.1 hypothetical protein [Candidatus Venteria ishoeyi]SEH08174.1 Uncharacterised protein [Candidatus Venteria ishoeyi]
MNIGIQLDIDFSLLRFPLFLFIFSFIISIAIVKVSDYYETQARQHNIEQKKRQQQADERFKETQEALSIAQDFYPDFQKLEQHHFLTAEQRLNDWIKVLRNMQNELELPGRLNPRDTENRIYHVPGIPVSKGFKVQLWSSSFDLPLLHMNDFFRFIKSIARQQTNRLYTFKSCSINRLHALNYKWKKSPGKKNLEAHCDLHWYTAEVKDDME